MGVGGAAATRRHGPVVLTLSAAIAFRFHHLVLRGETALTDEMADEYLALAANVFAHVRRGEFPLWSPEILFGYPVSLTVDLHAFSPFSWPFLLWPAHVALAVQMLAFPLCAALGVYALARRLQTSVPAATGAAILWVSGCPADNLLLVSMGLATLPWIPWAVVSWDHYGRTGDLRWATVTGGVLGLAILGGHQQFVYWGTVFLVGHLVFVVRPLERGRDLGWRLVRGLAVACLLAVVMAGVLLLPMTEILQDSIRSRLEPAQRIHTGILSLAETARALGWTVFCGQLHTAVEGDVEFRSVGLLPVLLALLAVGRGRRLDNRLAVFGLAFLVLSLGAVFAPSHWIVKHLPFNEFRYPSRIAIFSSLSVVLLAGRAIDRLVAGEARRWPNLVALGALVALCAPGVAALLRAPHPLRVSEGLRDVAAVVFLAGALATTADGRWARGLRAGLVVLATLAFLMHSQAMTTTYRQPPFVTAKAWGRDRGLWGHREGGRAPYPPPYLRSVPREDEHGPTRMLHLDTPWEHDLPLLSGHHAPTGLVSLRPGRVDRLVYGRYVASHQELPLTHTVAARQGLLDLFNVQYLVASRAWAERHATAERGSSLVIRQPLGTRFVLVENRTHLPRSFFVAHAGIARSEAEAVAAVTNEGFDPRRKVILEGLASPPVNEGDPLFLPARVDAYDGEHVQVEVAAPRDGWVVLLDRWAPGWTAQVDGRPVPLLRANDLFRAVRVPAGRCRVVFEYENRLFRWGLGASAAGLAATVAAATSLLLSRRGTR